MRWGVAGPGGIAARFAEAMRLVDGSDIVAAVLTAEDVTVISTGHLAGLLIDDCACFTVHSPWLTLHGLRLVFERNS